MCDISYSFSRHRVVDFSDYLYLDEHTFMAQTPSSLRDVYWIFLLAPFDIFIWIAILGTMLVFFAAITFKKRISEKTSSSFLKTVAIFLMQCKCYFIWLNFSLNFYKNVAANKCIQREKQTCLQLLFIFSLLSIFTLCQFYFTALYSMLTVPPFKKPLDTLEDLISAADPSSEYRFYVQNNSFFLEDFFQATPTHNLLYYAIGRKFNSSPDAIFSNQDQVARLLDASPLNVILTDRVGVEVVTLDQLNTTIHLGRENFDTSFSGIIFPKGSPLVLPFNVVIRHLREMGIIERLINLIVDISQRKHKFRLNSFSLKSNKDKNSGVRVFSLADLRSIFTLTSIGILIALLFFVFECLRSLFQNNPQIDLFSSQIMKYKREHIN